MSPHLRFLHRTIAHHPSRRRSKVAPVFVAITVGLGALVACADFAEIGEDDGQSSRGGAGGEGPGNSGGGLNVRPPGQGGSAPEPETPWDCGDGNLEPGEICDDGNTSGGDGCSRDCQVQNPAYDCSTPGEPCELAVECGNGEIEGDEACDDANEAAGDGCAADCKSVEEGYACGRPGTRCVEIPVCGDGRRQRGEECDAGPASDPGCIECVLTDGYFCLVPGEACLLADCGDGVRTPDEACDDAGAAGGCAADCNSVVPGWRCGASGCQEICGDGLLIGDEQCDDGQEVPVNGDGCSAGCRFEPGFVCSGPQMGSCVEAVCGNGVTEPGEGCDDDNEIAGDGCGPTCQNEPTFDSEGVAQLACGDGLITGDEECDDGNLANGDGCDEDCVVEEGFVCEDFISRPESVDFLVTYRDFKRRADSGGHPDFEWVSNPTRKGIPGPVCTTANSAPCESAPGAVCPAGTCGVLDADGKPVFHLTGTDSERGRVTSAATYALWYRDTNAGNVAGENGVIDMWNTEDVLTLDQVGGADSDVYQFSSSAHFPLTGDGFGNTPNQTRNFHFTTELRYFFQYNGGETLTFRGDDDVWVFVNGRHAVDIGGIHCAQAGRVVLGDEDASCSLHGTDYDGDCATVGTLPACDETTGYTTAEQADNTDNRFGLTKGGVYQIVIFHAERHTSASNFNLTLAGFLAPRSSCRPDCGDGVVTAWEVCDDGDDNADGVYGVCNSTCSGWEYCGDGQLQSSEEECDDGFNLTLYDEGITEGACAPGCVEPPYCGDGTFDPGFEVCDEGENNQDDTYETCNTSCDWGPYCGDGQLQDTEGETCDEGIGPGGNVPYGDGPDECGLDCREAPYCGDGERNGQEECDEGDGMNTGEYGGCNEDCTRAPYCGDRVVQGSEGEQCDAGPIGSLACSTTCKNRQVIPR